jgi:hypothetical protein
LEKAPAEKRDKMLDLVHNFSIDILNDNTKIINLAELYIKNNIIPARSVMDARHIAISVVNKLDKIISLNFKHIVRDKTRIFTEYICKIYGCNLITINSPMEVIDND